MYTDILYIKAMKKILTLFISMLLFAGCSKTEKVQELKIYSIIHEEETQALTDLFTQKTGIPVTFLRASTGELVNRVIRRCFFLSYSGCTGRCS